jgi:drug/metabolite transporter (DMT)-like permease
MSGALWAVVAGVGFGIFQTLNRRAVADMDVFVATFMQLAVSAVMLIGISVATQDISQLWRATPSAWLNFCVAGLIHFFIGWTFLNASQKRIGAARTSALIGTSPLFAGAISFVTLGETPGLLGLAGVALIVAGVLVTNNPMAKSQGNSENSSPALVTWISLTLALAAPLAWSISPTFTRYGLQSLRSPLLGVTVGLTASALAYGVALGIRSLGSPLGAISTDALLFKLIAGVFVGLSTWLRWIALDLAPVAVVLALSLVSVPTVNMLTPLVVEKHIEQVTTQIWLGSALIVAGSLILIFT